MRVKIYSKTGCPYCDMAKEWMNNHNIGYIEIKKDDLSERNQLYEQLSQMTGKNIRTVPQIFYDGTYIGGYNDLISSDLATMVALDNFDEDF